MLLAVAYDVRMQNRRVQNRSSYTNPASKGHIRNGKAYACIGKLM